MIVFEKKLGSKYKLRNKFLLYPKGGIKDLAIHFFLFFDYYKLRTTIPVIFI